MDVPASIDGRLRAAWPTAIIFFLLGFAALSIDLPVSRERAQLANFALHRQLWMLAELFGHGMGVLFIAFCIYLVDAARRPYLPRILACAFGSGMTTNAIKVLVARSRPRALDLAACDSVFSSFHGLRWWTGSKADISIWDSAYQSFPSGHAATAAGFAAGIYWLYPRARTVVAVLAGGVALQRVVVGAHFLSDTLVGAAVGCVVAASCLDRRALGRRFDVWERKLRKRRSNQAGQEADESLASQRASNGAILERKVA